MKNDLPITLEGKEPSDLDDFIMICLGTLYVFLFLTGLVSAYYLVKWIVGVTA